MAVNITDDEAVEDRESFYVELTTNDECIEFSRFTSKQESTFMMMTVRLYYTRSYTVTVLSGN